MFTSENFRKKWLWLWIVTIPIFGTVAALIWPFYDDYVDSRLTLFQTLIGGILAFGGGLYAFIALAAQIRTSERLHEDTIYRRNRSRSMAVSLSLATAVEDVGVHASRLADAVEESLGGITQRLQATIIEEIGPDLVRVKDRLYQKIDWACNVLLEVDADAQVGPLGQTNIAANAMGLLEPSIFFFLKFAYEGKRPPNERVDKFRCYVAYLEACAGALRAAAKAQGDYRHDSVTAAVAEVERLTDMVRNDP